MSDRPPTHDAGPGDLSAEAARSGDAGVIVLGAGGETVDVSPRLCAMAGYAAEELVSLPAGSLPLWPRFGADGERLRALFAAALADGVAGGVDIELRRRDATPLAVRIRVDPLLGASGAVDGALATVSPGGGGGPDVAEDAPAMLRVSGADARCRYANAAWLRFRGRALADELGEGWLGGVHPDDVPALIAGHAAAAADDRPMELEYRLRDAGGTYRWVLERGAPRSVGTPGAAREIVGVVLDVTAARQARLRMREVGAVLDAFAVLAPCDGASEAAGDLRVLEVNARAAAFLGRTPQEVLGRRLSELVPADVADLLLADIARARRDGVVRREQRSAVPGREDRMVEVEVAAIDGGEIALAWRDVTARRQAEARSDASDERYRALAHGVPIAIFETDPGGRCTFVNEPWCALSGLDAAQSLGFGWLQAIHPDDRERVARVWSEALACGGTCDQEYRLLRPDGSVRLVACTTVPRGGDGSVAGYLGTVADITDARRAERHDAALRRVAVAVAEESAPPVVFAMVAEEAARLLDAEVGLVDRFDPDRSVCVGGWDASGATVTGVWSLADDNLVARVRRSGEPVHVADLSAIRDPQVSEWARRRGLCGGVAAPVRVGGRLWGTVAVIMGDRTPVPPLAEEQLNRFAGLVSLAIAHAEERERRVGEAVADIFTGELDPEETLAAIVTSSKRALHAERATCYLYSRAGTTVGEMHTTEDDPERLRALRAAIGRDREQLPLDRALVEHDPMLVIEDVADHPSVSPGLAAAIGAQALIGIRLEHPSSRAAVGGHIGSLWLSFAAPRRFSSRDRRAARSLGAVAAIALSNARLRKATDLGSRTASRGAVDELTGLPTHRAFQERLAEQFERFRRAGASLAVAVLDLDRFSVINERFGHRAGDDVLREAAGRLAELAGDGDVVARVGGEQFAWLMIGTGGTEAWQAADRARTAIAATRFPGVGRVTASVGVAEIAQAGEASELYRLAAGALYWAKHHGRDVTFAYSPEVVEVLSAEEQAERFRHVQALQSIRVLARAVDAKDSSTRRHSERVADLAVAIAAELGWDEARRALLREAGLVHDVGKIGIPDAVLFKTGPLDAQEYELIRTHAVIGAEMVSEVLTEEQVAWVRHHHERIDGRGYPDGVLGPALPVGARILGLADAWDVMTSDRPYRQPLGRAEALAECRRCAGAQFDGDLVAVLERLVTNGGVPGD